MHRLDYGRIMPRVQHRLHQHKLLCSRTHHVFINQRLMLTGALSITVAVIPLRNLTRSETERGFTETSRNKQGQAECRLTSWANFEPIGVSNFEGVKKNGAPFEIAATPDRPRSKKKKEHNTHHPALIQKQKKMLPTIHHRTQVDDS